MTLENIYYIGQTIAVGAILVSLVAIYIQQRKDHALARAEHQREILDSSTRLFDSIRLQPTGLESVRKCLVDFEGAEPDQQAEFGAFAMQTLLLAEKAMYADQDGLLVDAALEAYLNIAVFFIGTPGGRQYWARTNPMFGDEIKTLLDERLQATPDTLPNLLEVMPYLLLRTGESSSSDNSSPSASTEITTHDHDAET